MYIDKEMEFSDAQAVTSSAASTNVCDLGAKGAELGLEGKYIRVGATAAATAAGAATVTFKVEADDDSGFGSAVEVYSSAAIGKAALVAGYELYIPMPPIDKRYIRVYYTVATGPLTAGAFDAALVEGVQKSVALPDAL